MNTFVYIIAAVLPVSFLIGLTVHSVRQSRKGVPGKKILATNLVGFLVSAVLVGAFTFAVTAIAADADSKDAPPVETEVSDERQAEPAQAEPAAAANTDGINKGLGLLAAALVTSLAGIGGGIAVAAGAPAAIAATTEDPKSFGKSLIFVALGESIALYGLVISIMILGKV